MEISGAEFGASTESLELGNCPQSNPSLETDWSKSDEAVLLPGDVNILHPRATKNTISSLFGLTLVFGVLNSSGALEPLIYDALNYRKAAPFQKKSLYSHEIDHCGRTSSSILYSNILSSINSSLSSINLGSSNLISSNLNLSSKSLSNLSSNTLSSVNSSSGTHFDAILAKRSVSSVDISWVFSVNLLFLLGAGIFAGCKIDRSGIKLLTYCSCVLATVSMFCFAKSGHHLANFIVLYGLFGVAQGVLMTCCFSGISCWYRKNLATFSAIVSLGGSFGGILFPIFIRHAYSRLGFEKTILIYAGIVGFLGLFCCLLCDDNFEERNLNTARRKESFSETCKIYFKETVNLKYFLDLKFLIISIGLSSAEIGTSIIATYLTSFCTKKGYSKEQAYTFITVMNAFGLLGRVWGFIADRWLGKFQTIFTCMFIASLSNFVFLLAFGKHMWSMYVFCAFYGSSISGFLSLCPTAVSVLCGKDDFGKRFSTMYLFAACASIPLLEISGLIIGDQSSSIRYQYFWIFTSLILLAGSLCYFYLRVSAMGFRWAQY